MQIETEKIIADILENQLGLQQGTVDSTTDNLIYIYNQDFTIPNTDGLFVVVGFQSSDVISNNSRTVFNSTIGKMVNIQESTQLETISIDLMSKNSDARKIRSEALMALQSIYAQQKQEEYNFRINRITSAFNNISDAEGSSLVNRYRLTIPVFTWYRKEVELPDGSDFYNQFTGEVNVEDPYIKFNLDEISST